VIPDRRVGRQGFRVDDVETGTGELSLFECGDEIGRDRRRATPDVVVVRARLHSSEHRGVDQPLGGSGVRQTVDDVVCFQQQFNQVADRGESFDNAVRFGIQRAANGDYPHSKRTCPGRERASDLTVADDQEGLPAQLEDATQRRLLAPLMISLGTTEGRQIAREGEHHAQGVLGDIGGMNAAAIGKDQVTSAEFGRQELFDASRTAMDPLQPRRRH
jgi:hypothetical protein